MVFDEEEYRRRKGGSVNLEDERLMKRFFAKSGQSSSGFSRSRRAGRIRYHNFRNYVGDQGKREAVVKVVSAKKSVSSVRALVEYISREHEEEKVQLYDQFGLPTNNGLIEKWNLRNDRENQRDDGRWRNNQAWHLVCSIQKEDDAEPEDTTAKLENAVRDFAAENFARNYFHVMWAVHDDTPDHPHAHLVIKARPDCGNRLHFDKTGEMIDILRDSFAEGLRKAGLDYVATRREDRHHIRRQIVTEEDVLRPTLPKGGHRVEGPIVLYLAQTIQPEKEKWFSFEKREKWEVPLLFECMYQEPESAYKNWVWLIQHPFSKERRSRSHRFGAWCLITRPELLGVVREPVHKPKNEQEVVNAFQGVDIPQWPENWHPRLRRCLRKRKDKEKMLGSLSRMFRNAISDPVERLELMQREWSDMSYELRRARQKKRDTYKKVKPPRRSGWSL